MRIWPVIISSLLAVVPALTACGDDDDGGGGAECVVEVSCDSTEKRSASACEACREIDDGCGGSLYCEPDPTCETPCPEGSFQEFMACSEDECVQRMACGELVTCRDQAACMATAECPDGGVPLESCAGVQNCLPYNVCGANMGCPTLTQCARDACDPGEVASTQDCSTYDLPCRTLSECGETFSCVCGAETLVCDEGMSRSSSPCAGGEICYEVTGCGQVFYCHGRSI